MQMISNIGIQSMHGNIENKYGENDDKFDIKSTIVNKIHIK